MREGHPPAAGHWQAATAALVTPTAQPQLHRPADLGASSEDALRRDATHSKGLLVTMSIALLALATPLSAPAARVPRWPWTASHLPSSPVRLHHSLTALAPPLRWSPPPPPDTSTDVTGTSSAPHPSTGCMPVLPAHINLVGRRPQWHGLVWWCQAPTQHWLHKGVHV